MTAATGSSELPPLALAGGASDTCVALTKIDHSVRAMVHANYE